MISSAQQPQVFGPFDGDFDPFDDDEDAVVLVTFGQGRPARSIRGVAALQSHGS